MAREPVTDTIRPTAAVSACPSDVLRLVSFIAKAPGKSRFVLSVFDKNQVYTTERMIEYLLISKLNHEYINIIFLKYGFIFAPSVEY